MPVANVVTVDTGEGLDDLLNSAGNEYGFDPVALVGLLIAESGLRATAAREGVWPDVSYGISQVAVAWAEIPGLARSGDGTALDTAANRAVARSFFFNAGNAIGYTVPRFAAYWRQGGGDALRACELWNAPGLDWDNPDPQHAANRDAYAAALAEAEAYRVDDGPAPLAPHTLATVVPSDGLWLRGAAGRSGAKIGLMAEGTTVYLGTRTQNVDNYTWREVAAEVGDTPRMFAGWCASEFLRGA